MLTAAEVEQKTFSTALRGYDLDEVDDFLDEVVATIREMNDQLEEARSARVAEPPAPAVLVPEIAPEPEPEPEPAPSPAPAIDESAVGRALVAAQAAADKLLEEAESQASRILDEAKEQADTWETEKEAKRAEAQAEMANLADRVRSVRSELAVLAEQVSGNLDQMDSVIVSSGVDGTGEEPSQDDGEVGEQAEPLTVADYGHSDEARWGEVETGADDTDTADGADHLDQILTGVAADLQLGESEDEAHGSHEDDDDEGEEDEEGEG